MPDLTPEEVAKELNVSIDTVHRLIKNGHLIAYKLGPLAKSAVRIEPIDLKYFKDHHRKVPKGEAS